MAQPPSPTKTVNNPRIAKLIELETRGVIKPEHQTELNVYRAQGLAPAAPKNTLTEAQGKSAGFYERALGANNDFIGIPDESQAGRGVMGDMAAAVLPTNVVNSNTSPDRQKANQAKEDFIRASLRYESGAAIGKDEFTGQDRIFFPQTGDSADVIKQKAEARQRVIDSLKLSAGPGASSATKAIDGADKPAGEVDINAAGGSPRQAFLDGIGKQIAAGEFKTPAEALAYAKGKDVALNADEVAKYFDYAAKGGKQAPAMYDHEPTPVNAGDGAMGSAARGLVDAVTINLAPRLTAAVETLKGNGSYDYNLDRQQGMRAFDEQNHGVARFMGSLPGMAAIPIGGELSAGRMAATGGGLGAAYGLFGSRDLTDVPDAAKNAIVGGATGAAAGYGIGKLSDYIRPRLGGGGGGSGPTIPPDTGNEVVDAAARQNIPIVAADAMPEARGVTRFLETVPGATGVMRNRLQAGNAAIEQGVTDLAGGVPAADREGVGGLVQTGAQNWIKKSSDIGGRLYDRAYQLSNGAQAVPKDMLQAIDDHLADLNRTPSANGAKINALTTLRNDLVDANGQPKPLDIDSLRNIRSGIREQMDSANVRSSDLDRRLDEVMAAGKGDIQQSLSSNPRALSAFDRADQFWLDRVGRVDNVLQKVIGKADNPISGEQVMSKIESMAAPRTGNAEGLRTLMSSLRPDEREQVAANIANSLGRESPEADFSTQRFWTQVQKLSPKARTAVFGPQGAEALQDLATIAEQRSNTLKGLNNSGSGFVSNWWKTITGIFSGAGTGAGVGALAGGAAGAGAGAGIGLGLAATGIGAANLSARALTNPAIIRWAAQGLKAGTKEAALNSIQRLGRIADSDPAIKAEVLTLQQRLTQAANDNFRLGSAAADGGSGQKKPPSSGDERQDQ